MHVRVIFRLLSVLSLIVCIFCFPCFCVAVGYAEIEAARAFILSIAVLAVPAALIIYFTQRTDSRMISSRDGYLLVFMAWLGASFFASFPFYLSESLPTLADSFFEAASGISTTGATVIPDLDIMPRSILLWRSVNHWLGGMGIVVLSVALLPLLGIGGVQLVKAESSGLDEARITSRVTQTAKYLWLIYISFTFICFILLFAGGMSVFDAVNHAFSTMASGGFSTKNLSIGFYASPYIHWVIIGSMIVAGGSFIFYYRLFTGQFKKIFHSSELRAYLFIIMTVGLAVSAFNYYYGIYAGIEANLRYGFFQVVSLLTTTGFFTTDYTFWFPIVQFMLFCLLFVGGCTGSTAGGFKVMRVVILLKQAVN